MNYKKIERNIKVEYFYSFFSAMNITSAIWVLYLAYKGMNLIEIGLLEGVFHLTGLVAEVPTGALADLLGRKKVIVLGRVSSIISAIIFLFSSNFFAFAIAFIFSALSYNLNSGSEEALFYDTLKTLKKEKSYIKINGRINFLIEIGMGIAAFTGGVLADFSFDYSYILAIVIGIVALGVASMFTEVDIKADEKKEEKISVAEHFKTSYKLVHNNKKLIFILLYFPTVFAMNAVVYFYSQQNFSLLGFSKTEIAIVFLLYSALSALGAISANTVDKILKSSMIVVLPILLAISTFAFSFNIIWLKLLSFAFVGYFSAVMQPLNSNWINKNIPSETRATLLSLQSMSYSVMMIILFPLSGAIGEYLNLDIAYAIIAILMVSLALVGYYVSNKLIKS